MLLFTPGPTPVSESTRAAMSKPTIHHRTPEFEEIFSKTRELLKKLFGYDEVLMLASSGTGAMEASVLNFCKQKALTINAGKFGERFGKIVQACGKELIELKYDWDTPAKVEDIKDALDNNPDIDIVCIQISESAGGLRHPVEEIFKTVKSINKNIITIADGITAVGVEKIDTNNMDVLISGSQKALMLPPGLALLGLSDFALNYLEKNGGSGYYLNLASELKSQRKNTTAYTAATTLIIGLKSILQEIDDKGGFEKLYEVTSKRAKATRLAMESLGLYIYPKSPAISMTTVIDKDSEKIRKILKDDLNVNVAGGQDHLKGKIFRINQMGLIDSHESCWVVNAIEIALDKIGRREFNGTANKIFCESYFK